MMRQWWWKISGVLILLYTIILGLLTPLKPGIVKIHNTQVTSGEVAEIEIVGYNTHFDEASQNKAYLRLENEKYLPSTNAISHSFNEITYIFDIPHFPESGEKIVVASLIINNEIDGSAVLPASVFIQQAPVPGAIHEGAFIDNLSGLVDPGWSFRFPYRSILHETIRNTFFHITLWFSMFIMLGTGVFYAIRYLKYRRVNDDLKSRALTSVSVLFGLLGLITGSIWARFTWGTWWTPDVKLNMTAVAMLIYLAYFVLRSSIKDQDQEARLASVYNVFAFVALIPLVFVIPRLTDSLHPGSGGNPALGGEDLDNTLRLVFYPAILGFTLLGIWMTSLYYRILNVKEKLLEKT